MDSIDPTTKNVASFVLGYFVGFFWARCFRGRVNPPRK
jgi:hypothetical protein